MTHKRIKQLAIVIIAIVLDIVLLMFFNTVLWPFLWPRPMIFIVVSIVVVAIWMPEFFEEIWLFRFVGAMMIFIGQSYALHSLYVAYTAPSILSLMHAVGSTGTFLIMVVNYWNQMAPLDNISPPDLPDDLPYVAAVIPTYGEPVSVLANTASSLKELDYPEDRLYIFISDDGHRPEVEELCYYLKIGYNRGAKKNAKAGNLNSALAHIAEHFPKATLIATQDADEIIDPTFLKKTVGYFMDPQIGFVQTPKEALSPSGDPFGVRDRVFYDVTQPGRNGSGAAFSCGSGVLWRIEAVHSIGGFAIWNIVEDLTTSYLLHKKGWKSQYHNEILTIGLAPDDIPGLLKQRGTWATDNWRLFLFKNPLFEEGLTLRQRLQYAELGLFYINSTFFLPLLMLVPVLSLLTGHFIPIEGSALFPWLVISLLYYYVFSRGNLDYMLIMLQYWVSHFWTYMKGFVIAVRSSNKKPSYKVTRKTRQDGFHGRLVWAQFLYLIVGLIAIIRGVFFLESASRIALFTNVGITLFFMYLTGSICHAAFHGVQLRLPRLSIPHISAPRLSIPRLPTLPLRPVRAAARAAATLLFSLR